MWPPGSAARRCSSTRRAGRASASACSRRCSPGLPVVASNVSSLPELVVDGETGILVRPDDPGALSVGVARALDAPELGEAGLTRARAEFSVERMARRTAELYGSL